MSKDPSFDDPHLKAALVRAIAPEHAPADLQARVQRAIAAEDTLPAADALSAMKLPRGGWRRNPLVGLAAAAMLLISLVIIYDNLPRSRQTLAYDLPAELASDMVNAHGAVLGRSVVHELDVDKEDMNRIRSTLSDRLGHPVLAAPLGDGWTFRGARITTMGTTQASQLVFTKGPETVSVFSVAGQSYLYGYGAADYAQMADGHPISGFVAGGAIHCVVGSKDSSMRLKQVTRLRDSIRNSVATSHPPGGQPVEQFALQH
jgi:hypothetical protein